MFVTGTLLVDMIYISYQIYIYISNYYDIYQIIMIYIYIYIYQIISKYMYILRLDLDKIATEFFLTEYVSENSQETLIKSLEKSE